MTTVRGDMAKTQSSCVHGEKGMKRECRGFAAGVGVEVERTQEYDHQVDSFQSHGT